ncbi:MAG: ATP-binding protein [Verrucomicrobiota bacterium]
MDCKTEFEGIVSVCPDCSEKRLRIEQDAAAANRARLRTAAWLSLCPLAYQHTDWKRTSRLCAKLAEFWTPGAEGKNNLILYGTTGAGKTRAAFAILQRMHQSGKNVYAIHAGDAWDKGEHVQGMSSAARLIFSDDNRVADAATQCLRRARVCSLLLIDDLGKERSDTKTGQLSEAVGEALFGLIEFRLVNRLPTIITTNMSGDALQKRLGPDRGGPLLRRFQDESLMPAI